MKKRICLLLAVGIISITTLSANACHKFLNKNAAEQSRATMKEIEVSVVQPTEIKDFEIIPTMNTVSKAKNRVWVGTFQLIWNDLIDELIKHPVEFVGTKSIMAENLNRKEITTDDLSDKSYYKKWGLASPAMKKEIEKGIKEKFNETSDILDNFDWTPQDRKYFLYAMLKKDFEYIEPFDKMPDAAFTGSEGNVKYFGIDGDSKYQLRNSVNVLFYNNSNDYAVQLRSKAGDIIDLYRTDDDKTFDLLYSDMLAKTEAFTGVKHLTHIDRFKAPMIEFKEETEFPELCNKPIKNTDFMISKTIETVQFKMDEVGVKLKSEAGMMMMATSAGPSREMPRYFYFNNTYVIFLLDAGKTKPYYAMRITDVKKLQK